MHLIIGLMAVIAFFLYLILQVRRDPEKRKQLYLYVFMDVLLSAVLVYLMFTGLVS